MNKSIRFFLNGSPQSSSDRPDQTVLEWLRDDALLRGTKEGCAEGDCGACSVLVKRAGDEHYLPVNSCIMIMGQLEGAALITVEGLAASGPDGHVVQQKMAENGSAQCGFCTPGIVASLAGLLAQTANPKEEEIHDALAGNLCRCTGYRPIVEAAQAAAKETFSALPDEEITTPAKQIGTKESQFYIPNSLDELLILRASHPDAVLLAGGTDLSLNVAHARERWPVTIHTHQVQELRKIELTQPQLFFGGAVSWNEALPYLQKYWPSCAAVRFCTNSFHGNHCREFGQCQSNRRRCAGPVGAGRETNPCEQQRRAGN